MWLLYTPNGGWRVIPSDQLTFYQHWLAKLPNLRWQLAYIQT